MSFKAKGYVLVLTCKLRSLKLCHFDKIKHEKESDSLCRNFYFWSSPNNQYLKKTKRYTQMKMVVVVGDRFIFIIDEG